jgi:Cof subfamily protein (haloacid dehalogenase superfamily)
VIRLVSCDLDGTLLDARAQVRPRAAHMLRWLWKHGVHIALATGRSWRTALAIQRRLGITGPVIAHNGAYVFDPHPGREWHRRGVPARQARQFVEWADTTGVMIRCYLGMGRPVLFNRLDFVHLLCWLKDEDRLVPQLASRLQDDPVEILLTGWEAVNQFIETFGYQGPDYELTVFNRPGYREVNICAPHVDKVEGLWTICRDLGISARDVMALGDGYNDVSMLTWAGLAVAMGHAPREVHQVADYVTPLDAPDPVQHALAWALRQGFFEPNLSLPNALQG